MQKESGKNKASYAYAGAQYVLIQFSVLRRFQVDMVTGAQLHIPCQGRRLLPWRNPGMFCGKSPFKVFLHFPAVGAHLSSYQARANVIIVRMELASSLHSATWGEIQVREGDDWP